MVYAMGRGVRHCALSRYVALLLASKSRSSHQVQITQSSTFAKANNGSWFSLEARSLLAQTTAFTLLRTYPWAFGPVDGVEIPIPSSLVDRCLLMQTSMTSLGAEILTPLAWTIPLSHALGKRTHTLTKI